MSGGDPRRSQKKIKFLTEHNSLSIIMRGGTDPNSTPSCIFGRARGHRPYTLLAFERVIASCTLFVAKIPSFS